MIKNVLAAQKNNPGTTFFVAFFVSIFMGALLESSYTEVAFLIFSVAVFNSFVIRILFATSLIGLSLFDLHFYVPQQFTDLEHLTGGLLEVSFSALSCYTIAYVFLEIDRFIKKLEN